MRSLLEHDAQLETVAILQSLNGSVADAVVDRRGVVYFDVTDASDESKRAILAKARPSERFMHRNRRVYCAAPTLRRHLPERARERFDLMVRVRREQALKLTGWNSTRPGVLAAVIRFLVRL